MLYKSQKNKKLMVFCWIKFFLKKNKKTRLHECVELVLLLGKLV